jgi:MPBQ/MSBQ methyltransferase
MTENFAISQVSRYQNAALNYYSNLTDSVDLHYGYWQPIPSSPDELTIANLRIAQANYTDKLLGFVPSEIKTVIDVGCGVGGNALHLLDRGLDVDGLAPDPIQRERFLERVGDRAIFHLTTFENFKSTRRYDLVFLSESSQYMAATNIAAGAAKIVNPKGYVLIADMLRTDPAYQTGIFSNCHLVTDLELALTQAGFELIKTEDISTHIAPTIDLCVDAFSRYGLSTLQYIGELGRIAVPPIYWVLRSIYRRWLKAPIVEGLDARNIFDRHLCYQIKLWQYTKENI